MRRLPLAVLVLLVACATPTIRLTTLHRVGDIRTYVLQADARSIIDLPPEREESSTLLVARSTIEVLSIDGAETTIRLTLEPTAFEQDGEPVTPPGEQTADVVIGADGTVLRVESVGGVPAEIVGTDLQDLAPVLGSPLPTGVVDVGDTWSTTLDPPSGATEPGRQTGRVTGLRVVHGFDAAMVALATQRTTVREQMVGEQSVRLGGTETATTEIAFAFREGFPVEVTTTAEGVFLIGNPQAPTGTLRIETLTTLLLEDEAA